jgi:hypothetical protein
MKELKKLLALSMVVGLWPVAAQAVIQIRPASLQDGSVGPYTDRTNVFGFWGTSGDPEVLWTQVGIHTLPAISPAQIASAELRIPETDSLWSGDALGQVDTETWSATHIDATNDAQIEDADVSSASLGNLGVYRAPGPRNKDGGRSTSFDVTNAVLADYGALRTTFAWRLNVLWLHDTLPSPSGSLYLPTVDNTDGFFGSFDGDAATDNHGARLLITLVPEPATAGLMLLGGLGLLRRRRRSA